MDQQSALNDFAARLNQLCDEKKLPARGRAELLRQRFGVSREAARKWLKGEAYPTQAKRLQIVSWASVTDHWLITGKGDKVPALSHMTHEQRTVLTYMQGMSASQQSLAVRLVFQLLSQAEPMGDPPEPFDTRRSINH